MKKIGQKIIAVSIFFGFAFWIVDTVLQHFIFNMGTFLDLLILKIPHHALYIRFLILGFLLIFGLTLSRVISNLKKTDEVLQEVFDQSQDVLYKRNLKTGKYEYMSPAITKIAGYTPDEMLSMSQNEIDALIHPEDLEKIYDIRQTISESPQNQEIIFELESRIKHKDGTYRWISDHFKLIRDANGHPSFSVASVRDITKHKKTEQELQLQGEIVANLSEGIYFCRVNDGTIIYANSKFEEICGYLPGEMKGKHVSIINAPTERTPKETVDSIVGIMKQTGGWKGEINNIKKDGSPFWCYASASIFNHPEHGEIIISVHTDITESKKAEEALKASEEKHRTLFETMTQGVIYQGADGKIFSANTAAEEILGLSLAQMQARTSIDPRWKAIRADGSDFPGEDHPAMVALKTGKKVKNVMMGVFNPTHEDYTWININATPQFRNGEKSPFQVYTTFEDITKKKVAEEDLHQYQYIVSSSTDMMALLDDQFKYLAVNKAYIDAFNLTSEKLVGQIVSEIFGEEFFETVIKPHAEQCLQGENVNYQDWFEFPTFGRKYMDISYSPYLSVDKEVLGFVVNARDITERKKAEEELINSNFWLEESQRVSKIGSYLLNIEKNEWESSKILNDIFGISDTYKKDTSGWVNIVHPEQRDEMLDYFQKEVFEKRKSFNKEYRIRRIRDGEERWVHGLGELSFDENTNPIKMLGTIQDITERKKVEEKLEKSQKDLKKLTAHLQTVREEERTLVAHELHDEIAQALTALKMDIYMLEKKLPLDQKDTSDQIIATKDLLDKTIQTTRKIYSELRPTLLEHFSIGEVLEDHLDTFKKSNKISGDTDIDLGGAELNEEISIAIFRIVQEALNNVKWHSQAKTVNIKLKKINHHIKLTVKDDGIGIKEENLNKSNSFGIIGMRERASFLEGEIEFKGIPEKGTTVTVTIPLNTKSN